MNNNPEKIFEEYKRGINFKSNLGTRGLYEQNRINERFFAGDQWYGAKCGNDRPLVRHNLIKRIGDYKMSLLLSAPTSVCFSAEGVPNTIGLADKTKNNRRILSGGEGAPIDFKNSDEEISLVMSALNDYYRVTAERVKFNSVSEQTLRNAYIGGTGIIYTYWDADIKTGLYADDKRTVQIKGDIVCESLNIEDVYFGDPKCEDVQSQPYIIIATKLRVDEARRQAVRNGVSRDNILLITSDTDDDDPNGKVTVLTKLYKVWDEQGNSRIMAKRVTANAVIRDEWDIGIRMYPIAKFCWERRRDCAYGDSEITYLIPNQIAVNRMITSNVWSTMMGGMPIMVVNGDLVDGDISNDPGQIIKVFGSNEDVAGAIKYVSQPDLGNNYLSVIEPLIDNTLSQSGASAAALGDVEPNNASAINSLRNAANMPLKMLQNRYFEFLEETARIWSEFWIMQYGNRKIKIQDENGVWYMPFNANRYKDLIICTSVSVGAANTWSEETAISTLNGLLDRGIIDAKQYLRRLPDGIIQDVGELIKNIREDAQ